MLNDSPRFMGPGRTERFTEDEEEASMEEEGEEEAAAAGPRGRGGGGGGGGPGRGEDAPDCDMPAAPEGEWEAATEEGRDAALMFRRPPPGAEPMEASPKGGAAAPAPPPASGGAEVKEEPRETPEAMVSLPRKGGIEKDRTAAPAASH